MKIWPASPSAVLLLLLLGGQRSAATPCNSPELATAPVVVVNTAGALQLAEAVNCSGGSFDVEWVGSVILEEPIRLVEGTTLSVTGTADGTSVVNGANVTPLFEVEGGTLNLYHLTLAHGSGDRGGAIYATDAKIATANCAISNNTGRDGGGAYLDGTVLETVNSSFTNNTGSGTGGAIYMKASNVAVGERVLFRNNEASSGGALFMVDSSSLTLAGDRITFEQNTATAYGGGIYARQSTANVTGKVEAFGNSAEFGGALFTDDSSVSVMGDMLLSDNFANDSGGAFYGGASAIDISGATVWERNLAFAGGGGLMLSEASMRVQASGEAEFMGNTAGNGGAAYVDNSTVFAYGNVCFSANLAKVDGGALYADLSFVDIAGFALLEANTAGERGGALANFLSTFTVLSSGEASFATNSATSSGGASFASNSSLVFDGDVVFAENAADENGGALRSDFSDMSITGTVVWKNNSAQLGGGGVFIWNSTLLVSSFGTAEFFDNIANSGGAIHSFRSTILFGGDVLFENNFANDLGGGMYGDGSAVTVTGTASWQNNTSLTSGGGVAIVGSTLHIMAGSNASVFKNTANVGGGMFVGESSTAIVTGLATFAYNLADTGAGVKMAIYSSANFTGGLVTILGNTAAVNGGGMHCESPTLLTLDGMQIVSNQAGVSGGGIKTLLAGTARVAETEAKPATISNSSFSGNIAGDTGGGLFIGGGFVDVTGSQFSNNYAARSGGAVFGLGIVSLESCVFVENKSGVGPAVTNTVSMAMSSVDFINNTLLCDDTTLFLDWNDTSSFDVACQSCSEGCSDCTVENPDKVQECHSVMEHTTSLDETGSLETLSLQQGYWRSSSTSTDIRECYESSACVGGTENYCEEGYGGPLCAVCVDDYTSGMGYTCSKCNGGRRGAAITVGAIIVAAVVAMVVRSIKFLGTDADLRAAVEGFSSQDIGEDRLGLVRAKASQAVKIIVVSWQIITQFSMVASVVYPDVYNTFLAYADVVNLNLGWMLSAGCLIDTDFYDNLLVSTIVPLVVVVVVATSHRIARSRTSTSDRKMCARIDRRHTSAIFWVSFLVYATVSSAIFQTFACDEIDTGRSYLRVDHSLECHTHQHVLFMLYAGVMGVVYPFGIPFCYGVVLYRGRAALRDAVKRESSTTDVTTLRELWGAYRPEVYYYEVVECVRRVVLSGVIVFIFPNTAGQIATAFLLALFFAAVFMALDPYTSGFDTLVARTGHMVVLMSMFVALLQKVDMGEDDEFSQNVFAIVLVFANLGMIVAAAAEACGMCFVAVREIRQPVAPMRKPAAHIIVPIVWREEDEHAPF